MRITLTLLAMLGLGLAVPASADTYSLTEDHCTGGCGTAPFGTIDVTQDGANTVLVDVNLSSSTAFVSTGFPGSLAFDVLGNPTIAVTNITAGWSLLNTSAGSLHFDGFGTLGYALECLVCGNGGSNPFSGPLSFEVTASGLTPASFLDPSTGGSDSAYFVADVMGSTGNTGPVGATFNGGSTSVPEPGTLGLFSLGLAGMLLARRRSLITT